jgi:hypothetical protein
MYEQICRNHSCGVGSLDCASPSRKICKFGIVTKSITAAWENSYLVKNTCFYYNSSIAISIELFPPVMLQLAKRYNGKPERIEEI